MELKVILLLAMAVLANATSEEHDGCSIGDRQELLSMWESVWDAQFTGRRVAIAQAAFAELFAKNAETKALFKNVNVDDTNSAEFRAHCIRVSNGLDTIINLAVDSDYLEEELIHLAAQHLKFPGMKAEYFKIFRDAFANILPQAVPCFNSGVWNRCIKLAQDKIAAPLQQ